MQITRELIESLLWEEESTTLDFKQEQYAFVNASNDEKSEMLKDILAFTNTFRRSDAFILLGIKEIKGGRSEVVGVASQLNDADLQQFVNSKTQRPVNFSYRATAHDGLPIAILHIPRQYRPIYAVKDFGRVKEQIVYLRRGSSTDRARPEEIARMGTDQSTVPSVEPKLELSLFERQTRKPLGNEAYFSAVLLHVPDEDDIPDYAEGGGGILAMPQVMGVNSDYFRDLVKYTRIRSFLRPVSLIVNNESTVSAQDVRLVFEIEAPSDEYAFVEEHAIPEPPSTRRDLLGHSAARLVNPSDIDIEKTPDGWRIECRFGKIQPRDSVKLLDDMYVGARQSGTLTVTGRIFADNLSEPVSTQFNLHFSVDSRVASLAEIEAMEHERFAQTSEGRKALDDQDDENESTASK